MSDGAKGQQREVVEGATIEAPGESTQPSDSKARKHYVAPRLRHLGSVRDLTWLSSGTGSDDNQQQLP